MRKAAEPADDVGMRLRVLDQLGVAGGVEQGKAAFLVGDVLGMLERKIEERLLGRRKILIESARKRARRHRPRKRIGRIGAGIAAEHVARELVEHDQQRQRVLGRSFPRRQAAVGAGLIGGEKAPPDLVIERRILLEPFVGTRGTSQGAATAFGGRLSGMASASSARADARNPTSSQRRQMPLLVLKHC
jgi:hypothetical protein